MLNLRSIISGESDTNNDVVMTPHISGDDIELTSREFTNDADDILDDVDVIEEGNAFVEELYEDMRVLSEVECILKENIEDENSDGIDAVTAEAINLMIKGISRRSGLPVSHLTSSITSESFSGDVSSRKTQTVLVYEGVGDALKAAGEKVMDVIKAVAKFVKDFWDKHLSTVGRQLKTVARLIKKARDLSGVIEEKDNMKAPSGYRKAFHTNDPITAKVISTMTKRHMKAMDDTLDILKNLHEVILDGTKALKKVEGKDIDPDIVEDPFGNTKGHESLFGEKREIASIGSEEEPLGGGTYGVLDVSSDSVDVNINIKWETAKLDELSGDQVWVPGVSGELVTILTELEDLLKVTSRMGGVIKDIIKDIERDSRAYQNASRKVGDDSSKEAVKLIDKLFKSFRDLSTFPPKISSKITGLNIKLSKQIIRYSKESMKLHKKEK